VQQSAATFKHFFQRLVNLKQTMQYDNTKYRNLIGVLLRLDMETISPEWRIQPWLQDSTQRTKEACKQLHGKQSLLHTHPSSPNTWLSKRNIYTTAEGCMLVRQDQVKSTRS